MAPTVPMLDDDPITAPDKADWIRLAEPLPPFEFPSPEGMLRSWRPRGRRKTWSKTFTLPPRAICWIDRVTLQPPLDQRPCNSCSAFTICAIMGDLAVIRNTPVPQLSPGFVHRCIGNCECRDMLDVDKVITLLRTRAVPARRDGDHPFPQDQCAGASGVLKLAGSSPLDTDLDAKYALTRGPVFGVMKLYADFWSEYGGGIYRRTSTDFEAAHSIEVVGYDDDQGCWYVKNSLGPTWGERGGFGRIAYGECGLFVPGKYGGYQLTI